MLFKNSNTASDIRVNINNHNKDGVTITKFLGILIDEGLNWKEHINLVKCKLSKTISVVGRCKNILDKEALYILYYTLFSPYINYCSEVWGNTYVSNLYRSVFCKRELYILQIKMDFRPHQ